MERLNVDSPLDRARTQTEDPRAKTRSNLLPVACANGSLTPSRLASRDGVNEPFAQATGSRLLLVFARGSSVCVLARSRGESTLRRSIVFVWAALRRPGAFFCVLPLLSVTHASAPRRRKLGAGSDTGNSGGSF